MIKTPRNPTRAPKTIEEQANAPKDAQTQDPEVSKHFGILRTSAFESGILENKRNPAPPTNTLNLVSKMKIAILASHDKHCQPRG